MRISHFFIDHPIFAAILSMFITIVGGVAYFTLPVSQYPAIALPIVQISSGVLGQPPVPQPGAFQLNVQTPGRLTDPVQFANIIVRSDSAGRITRIGDIGRVELGAQDYGSTGYLDTMDAVPLLIYQQPGSNALSTAQRVHDTVAELAKSFPEDLRYDIVYDTTGFIAQSVHEVLVTILEAVALVVVVVILFLQTWRASIIPIMAIPVSLERRRNKDFLQKKQKLLLDLRLTQ